jgi:hypothetical protein
MPRIVSSFSMIAPCAEPRREDAMNYLRSATPSAHGGRGVLLALCLFAAAGCAQSVAPIEDMGSFDPSLDQMAFADSYRAEAVALKEKAAALAESVIRYEHLFGSQSDLVNGAKQLSQYYVEAAQELERRAEAHAEVARTGQRKLPLPPNACCNK